MLNTLLAIMCTMIFSTNSFAECDLTAKQYDKNKEQEDFFQKLTPAANRNKYIITVKDISPRASTPYSSENEKVQAFADFQKNLFSTDKVSLETMYNACETHYLGITAERNVNVESIITNSKCKVSGLGTYTIWSFVIQQASTATSATAAPIKYLTIAPAYQVITQSSNDKTKFCAGSDQKNELKN
jgi:hypothetical protein